MMQQLFYWLAAFAKTISLLSLIILIPDNPFHKQIYSKAFLILYLNEILLFLIDALVNMFSQPQFGQYFPLSQAIMNVYFVVIITVVITWLMQYQKDSLSDKMTSLSTIVTAFVWIAVVCVGIAALATKSIENVRSLGELAYGLAWTMSLLKFILQYRVNSLTNTFGLGFIFLFTNIAWIVFELLSKSLQKWSPNNQNQQQKQTSFNTTTIVFVILLGLISFCYNMVMLKQRKAMINSIRDLQRQEEKLKQAGVGITQSMIVDERGRGTATFNVGQEVCSLEQLTEKEQGYGVETKNSLTDSLLNKSRNYTPSAVTTKHSTSFADSIKNY